MIYQTAVTPVVSQKIAFITMSENFWQHMLFTHL